MLYHHHGRFAVGVFRGGYLGVDIFFVLSGFLITWLLLHEWSTSGSIHFVAFWGRRARRLVPALLAMLVVVAVLDRFVYPTSLQPVIRADVPWVLGYLENWHLASAGGATSSPLSHSWSLAVEEQWYLLWPVALMILLRLTRNRPRRLLGTVVSLAAVGAVGTAVAFNGSDGYRVFFGTDARAQELLVGSALAVWCATMASPRSRMPGPLLDRAGLLALLMLGAYAVAGPSSLPALRGGYLVAALVTALVILSAMVPGSWAGSLLARRELVAVGRVSYGLYLFHFPIYRWLNPPATGLDGWPLFVLRFAVNRGRCAGIIRVDRTADSSRPPPRDPAGRARCGRRCGRPHCDIGWSGRGDTATAVEVPVVHARYGGRRQSDGNNENSGGRKRRGDQSRDSDGRPLPNRQVRGICRRCCRVWVYVDLAKVCGHHWRCRGVGEGLSSALGRTSSECARPARPCRNSDRPIDDLSTRPCD